MGLVIGGCPKRQMTPRLVYVPAPPSADAVQSSTEAMVIEEPPPPLPTPQEALPSPPAAPRPAHRARRASPNEPAGTTEINPEPADEPSPSIEVPALEPRESTEQESALRSQTLGLQNDVQQRITRLAPTRIGPGDRRTLEDSRTFLSQSQKALEEGDLQRSLNLARKASLLVTALENQKQ
jgi:hypothetical protein